MGKSKMRCGYLVPRDEVVGGSEVDSPQPKLGGPGLGDLVTLCHVLRSSWRPVSRLLQSSAQDGSQKWKRSVVGITQGLTVGDGVVAYTRWDGSETYLGALEAKGGRPLWGPVPINNVQYTSMPAIANKQIYAWIFINDYGYVADYDAKHGTEYWNYTIARSFPSVENGIVWIAFNGTSLALDDATGQYLWNVGGTDNFTLPIIVNGVVYGGCSGTSVCAYGLPSNRARIR